MLDTSKLENKAMKTVKLKNNSSCAIHGLKPDGVIEVACDAEGMPLDKKWRRRVKDSAIDGAIKVVKGAK